jgi:demethylmenaquinone methyltransferase/2-methoxy-6-polyprenyl-1,4-benzoquinol methylase
MSERSGPGDHVELPTAVVAALARAEAAGFKLSSEPGVGALLAALAASVRSRGHILELGTGAGVGLAWLVSGLGTRTDIEVITVDINAELQSATRAAGWPAYVRFDIGDGAVRAGQLGRFDLIFADAQGGKTVGLDQTIEALSPGGILVVDDMDLALHDDPELSEALTRVRAQLLGDRRLVCADLTYSSGVILATRRRDAD